MTNALKNAFSLKALDIPYVKDGIISMWDGEWNSGLKMHSKSASVWKDLVGDRDLNLCNCTVKDSSVCTPNPYERLQIGYASAETNLQLQDFTVEVCFRNADYDTQLVSENIFLNLCTFEDENATRYGGARIQKNAGSFSGGNATYQIDSTWSYRTYTNDELRHNATYALVGDGNAKMLYRDGSLISGATRNLLDMRIQYICIGEAASFIYYGESTTHLPADYCCVRLYSRALNADEIRGNALADESRFVGII